jgi:hypothetical protein
VNTVRVIDKYEALMEGVNQCPRKISGFSDNCFTTYPICIRLESKLSLCSERETGGGGLFEPSHGKALSEFAIISLCIIKSPIT